MDIQAGQHPQPTMVLDQSAQFQLHGSCQEILGHAVRVLNRGIAVERKWVSLLAFEENPVMVTDAVLFRWTDVRLDATLGLNPSIVAPAAPAAQQFQPDPNLLGYLNSALVISNGNVLHAQQVQMQQGTPTTSTGIIGVPGTTMTFMRLLQSRVVPMWETIKIFA